MWPVPKQRSEVKQDWIWGVEAFQRLLCVPAYDLPVNAAPRRSGTRGLVIFTQRPPQNLMSPRTGALISACPSGNLVFIPQWFL